MENTRFLTLLARQVAGEATQPEKQELNDLIRENKDMEWFNTFFSKWKEPDHPVSEESYQRLMKRIAEDK